MYMHDEDTAHLFCDYPVITTKIEDSFEKFIFVNEMMNCTNKSLI